MARGLKFCIYRKKGDCTIYVAKTKALISFAVTAKLICVFVFAYAKCWFSYDAAHIELQSNKANNLGFGPSKDSDQSEHPPPSSIRAFTILINSLHAG